MRAALLCAILLAATSAESATHIRIVPAADGVLAAGQRFDVRVEATSDVDAPPRGLTVTINGENVTARNMLDAGPGGERGAGGTGATGSTLPPHHRAGPAPPGTSNFLLRDLEAQPGPLVIAARTADGASAEVRLTVEAWTAAGARRARNIILLLGDGMGIAHRTAARVLSRGVRNGKAGGRLAMDTLDVTGLVMTASLNSPITDSSPGMASYVTGQKNNNNQAGVFPDNTADMFDNPRVEYLGALMRRTRGRGFNVGIVSTADVTDSTPAANAVHVADRSSGPGIASQFFDERDRSGVTVLLGGGGQHFMPKSAGGTRPDERRVAEEFENAGYTRIGRGADVRALLARPQPPPALLGLFHQSHLPVAFDKVGAGRYSDELALPRNAAYRDMPMLDDLARLALRTLTAHSPAGFYLMIEGASIDKRSHGADAERAVWDVLEFDHAVQVAVDFAKATNTDADPANDTLVIVTADHETGGLAIVGVGNERYAPAALGRAVRDYAAVYRFRPEQELVFEPNYTLDANGYPVDPDPSRKLLLGWAAAPDRYENWTSNRLQLEPGAASPVERGTAIANPARDAYAGGDNNAVSGKPIPGFLVTGVIENGAVGCPVVEGCPGDTAAMAQTVSGHTGTDVPLSASGPGAWQFTGVFENTDVFLKILRATVGGYEQPGR